MWNKVGFLSDTKLHQNCYKKNIHLIYLLMNEN